MPLTDGERQALLRIAEDAVRGTTQGSNLTSPPPPTSALTMPGCAFVTIRMGRELRGCIGATQPTRPLWQTVRDAAVSAASRDPRFSPVTPDELHDLHLEISVLSPFKKIRSAEEIEIGRDGLVIRTDSAYGLLLPQVAPEWGWGRQEFLEQTCLKAGLPREAWEDPGVEILSFSAEVFSRPVPWRVMVVCTGNIARSQIGEGWFRHLGGDRIEIHSAGAEPKEQLHPLAVQVMAEAGVDISNQHPKRLDPALAASMDHLITVCGAARDRCPVLPAFVRRLHWPIEDPMHSDIETFRAIRDDLRARIEGFLKSLVPSRQPD